MRSAQYHSQENERLRALEQLQLLDTLPEKEFDEITLMASQICETPIALVSLIDKSRQWFKSKHGLSASETPREFAFCAHAILEKDTFIVPDATKDERFYNNPLVIGGPNVIFYAGEPLMSPDGLPIGTLCVIDNKPKVLSEDKKNALKALSNQVGKLLELRMQLQQQNVYIQKLNYKKAAIENLSEGIVLQNADSDVVDFNAKVLEMLGLTASELTQKIPMHREWSAINIDGTPFSPHRLLQLMAIRSNQEQETIVIGVQSFDPEVRWLQIRSTPIFENNSNVPAYLLTSYIDITNIKKIEEERQLLAVKMFENSKLSTLGEMAGGIAHELNTPLAIITVKTSMLLQSFDKGMFNAQDVERQIKKIMATAERIAKIIRGLRLFSRNSANDPLEPVSLASVVQSTLDLCQEKIAHAQITLSTECSNDSLVLARSAEISQVLMNLISNAIDAVECLDEKWIKITLFQDNEKIFLSVIDSGKGLPPDIEDKIMNPFFTTKVVGKGTGLGLSISNGIVGAHKGKLYYDKMSKNTRFVIELPLHKNANQESVA